jgi:hypothetical protein
MLKIQIAGFMSSPLPPNIKYIASPAINIEKMEAEEVAGFDFKLPKNIIGNLYDNDDIELKIEHDIEPYTTSVFLSSTSSLVSGDYYWIKNELVQVTVVSSTEISITRGEKGTFPNRYIKNDDREEYYYIRKYPKSLIGQRVFLYAGYDLLTIGLIKEQPKFNGSVLEFSCDNAISSLDVPFTIPLESEVVYNGNYDFLSVQSLSIALNFNYLYDEEIFNVYYDKEVPPILDYLSFPEILSIMPHSEYLTTIKYSDMPKILDFMNLYAKLNGSVFTWNHHLAKYTVIQISDISSLDNVANRTISKYVNIKSNYSSKPYSGIAQISIKLENNVKINLNSINIMQFAKDSILELDLTKYMDIRPRDVKDVLFFYSRLFSVIYSELTIPTHYSKFKDFKEGCFYNITDLDKFFTFQNISSKVFCLKKDEDKVTFLVTRNIVKNPIAPAIYGKMDSTNKFLAINFRDYLDCMCSDIENAKIEYYDYKYFMQDDIVEFIDSSGVKTQCKITDISGNLISLDASFTAGTYGFLTYAKATEVNTRQQIFFYLDNSEW